VKAEEDDDGAAELLSPRVESKAAEDAAEADDEAFEVPGFWAEPADRTTGAEPARDDEPPELPRGGWTAPPARDRAGFQGFDIPETVPARPPFIPSERMNARASSPPARWAACESPARGTSGSIPPPTTPPRGTMVIDSVAELEARAESNEIARLIVPASEGEVVRA
jgi:hypothetical protein